jgi:hypothetical protein
MSNRNPRDIEQISGDQVPLQHGTLQLKYCQYTAQSFFVREPNHSLGQVNVCEEMKEVEHLDFHDIDDRSKSVS